MGKSLNELVLILLHVCVSESSFLLGLCVLCEVCTKADECVGHCVYKIIYLTRWQHYYGLTFFTLRIE